MRLDRRWQFAVALVSLSVVGVILFFWAVLHAGFTHSAPELEYDTTGAVWTNAWIAHAIAHFQNPFFSPNVMHPYGLNLLANAYNIGFSALFAPVTWALGPIASLNAQLMFIPIANTVVMGFCLRRLIRSRWLCVAGGLMWGFSPFVETSLAKGWTNVGFVIILPIVAWLLAELVEGRGWSARRIGLALAVVVIAQYFVDSELLFITGIGALCGVVVILIQRRRSWSSARRRYRIFGLWFAVPTVVVLAAPVAYGIYGPHPPPSWVRPAATFRLFVSPLRGVIATPRNPTLPPNLLFHGTANPSYLGVGLVAVVVLGLVMLRLPKQILAVLAVGLFGLWLSVGYGPWWSPFPIIEKIPVIHNVTVTRFIILTWFAGVVLSVYVAQRCLDWMKTKSLPLFAAVAACAALVLAAFVPPLVAVAQTLPLSTSSSVGDKALATVLTGGGTRVVMGFPFPVSVREMLQQAKLGDFSFDMPGGEWPQIFDAPEPATTTNQLLLTVGRDRLLSAPTASEIALLDDWIVKWGVTDVIIPRTYQPAYAVVYASPRQFVALITEALGLPRVIDGEWVWTDVNKFRAQPKMVLTSSRWDQCANDLAQLDPIPACVMHKIGASS